MRANPSALNAAVVAALREPLDAPHGSAVMTFVTATATVAFVVLGAARDCAASVNDQRARARRQTGALFRAAPNGVGRGTRQGRYFVGPSPRELMFCSARLSFRSGAHNRLRSRKRSVVRRHLTAYLTDLYGSPLV